MRKLIMIFSLVLILSLHTIAQNKRLISIQLSVNQIELGLEHQILSEKLSADIYTGIANQDINNNFDDFSIRFGFGYKAISNSKNQIALHSGIGLYFSNNDYYSITVPLVNADFRYTRFIGKREKHGLFINVGYRYGKREFKQIYASDIVEITTADRLILKPVQLTVGYGFKF